MDQIKNKFYMQNLLKPVKLSGTRDRISIWFWIRDVGNGRTVALSIDAQKTSGVRLRRSMRDSPGRFSSPS